MIINTIRYYYFYLFVYARVCVYAIQLGKPLKNIISDRRDVYWKRNENGEWC